MRSTVRGKRCAVRRPVQSTDSRSRACSRVTCAAPSTPRALRTRAHGEEIWFGMATARAHRRSAESDDRHTQLRAAGLRATPARLALLGVLAAEAVPVSVSHLADRLRSAAVDQATVYRAVRSLTAAGIVRPVDFAHGHVHVELSGTADHHHLICTSCGAVEDFTECGIAAVIRRTLRRSRRFRSVDRHALELFGVCTACRSGRSRRSRHHG